MHVYQIPHPRARDSYITRDKRPTLGAIRVLSSSFPHSSFLIAFSPFRVGETGAGGVSILSSRSW